MGWIKDAFDRGELKIIENMMCPFCNPTKAPNKPTKINACEEHRWVNKKWYEGTCDSNGDIRRRRS